MHRHGYQGKKFGRKTDQRRALIKGLAEALIIHESIETTISKAKELVPYAEGLITKAKSPSLHNRRLVMARLSTVASGHKLMDEIAPKLGKRPGGHLRIVKTTTRRGDNTQLARVSFVDDLSKEAPKPAKAEKPAPKPVAKKTAIKKAPAKPKTKAAKK